MPYAPAVLLAVGTALLYALTLCPTVYWYDSAEFAAHAASLGVPHPPGYPLYTLLAHVFTWLPGEPAWGVNVMSAVCGVVSVLFVYGIARNLGAGAWPAVFAGATLATCRTFWANAVVAEVYTPGLVFTLGVFLVLQAAERRRSFRLELVAGWLAGLGVGVHMSIATCGLGYAALVLSRRPTDPGRFAWLRVAGRAVAVAFAVGVGLLVFLYIPWRTFERWSPGEWRGFYANATGGTFKRKFAGGDALERGELMLSLFTDNLQWVGLLLALAGFGVLLRRRPRWGAALLLAAIGNIGAFFNYHVPDLDVFILPAIAVFCIGAGLAVHAAGEQLATWRPRAVFALAFAGLLPLTNLVINYAAVDLSGRYEAATYGERVCDAIEEPAVVVSYSSPQEWRYYAVFLYVQRALGRCADVEVLKKPPAKRLHALLASGVNVYVFRPLRRMKAFGRVVQVDVLWRVIPRG